MITSKEFWLNTACTSLQVIDTQPSLKWVIHGCTYVVTYSIIFKFSPIEGVMFYLFNIGTNEVVDWGIEELAKNNEGYFSKGKELLRKASSTLLSFSQPTAEKVEKVISHKNYILKISKHIFFDVCRTEDPDVILEMLVRSMLARALSLIIMTLLFGISTSQSSRILLLYLIFYAGAYFFMLVLNNTSEIKTYNPKDASFTKLLLEYLFFIKPELKEGNEN